MKTIAYWITHGVVHFIYGAWTLYTWIIYRPKIVYMDKSMKKTLRSQACILIANHTSHNDGSFVPQAMRRVKPYVLVTRKWYDKKCFNWLFRHLRYIPINLADMDNEWMDKSEKVLEKGDSILIFPEGQLSKDGTLGQFFPGFLMLARHTDAPVIPVVINGGYRKFHRQTLTVGTPIEADIHRKGRPSQILSEAAVVCRERMLAMQQEIAGGEKSQKAEEDNREQQ